MLDQELDTLRSLGPTAVTLGVFDGVHLTIDQPFTEASYDYANSGWVQGNGIMRILPTPRESKFMPWDYDIIFTSDPSRYSTITTSKLKIRDETDTRIATNQILLGQNFNFYVIGANAWHSLFTIFYF